MGRERRRFLRVAVVVAVEVTDAAPARRFIMRTRDISDGGAYLVGREVELPSPGSDVTLQVLDTLGDGERPPAVRARVVRVLDDGMAVEFIE